MPDDETKNTDLTYWETKMAVFQYDEEKSIKRRISAWEYVQFPKADTRDFTEPC